MRYTLEWLLEKQKGERLKFIHFWGHQPSPDGTLTSSCFSQWWECDFFIDDIRYPTAEHFMMAEKARLFGDEEARAKILACTKPGEAKEFGRSVRNFKEEIWNGTRYSIVLKGNLAKFSQNDQLRNFLINTNDRILVEASPVDAIWGIGHARDHRFAHQPENWRGLNLLGFALMEVRDKLCE